MIAFLQRVTSHRLLMMALVLVAFGLRAYHLDFQSLWRDEVDAIRFSSPPVLQLESPTAIINSLRRQGHNGPLYFIVLAGWRAITGDSAFALRYGSLVAGVLLVPLGERLARRLGFQPSTAYLCALLLTTSPYLIWYAQEAKMYSWLALLVAGSIYLYHTALKRNPAGRWWVLFVVVTSLTFYIHILAPLMVLVYALWGLLRWQRLGQQRLAWLLALAVLTLPYLPLLWWQANLFWTGFESGHPHYSWGDQLGLLLHLYSVGVLRTEYRFWAMGLFLGLALLGGWNLFRHRPGQPHDLRFLLLWLVAPLVAVYLVSLRVAVFEDRYLIYVLPAFYLLVAWGLTGLAQSWPNLGRAITISLLLFNLWSIWLQSNQVIKPDFQAAAAYIAAKTASDAFAQQQALQQSQTVTRVTEHQLFLPIVDQTVRASAVGPTVMIQMPYLHHTFGYYHPQPYQPLDGLWTNDGRSPATVDTDMRQLTDNLNDLWLVVAEEDHWDSRHLTRSWLDSQATRIDQQNFVGVQVYRYQFE